MLPKLFVMTLIRYSGNKLIGIQSYSVVAASRDGAIRRLTKDIPDFRELFQEVVVSRRSIPLFLLSMLIPFITVKTGGSSDWLETKSL